MNGIIFNDDSAFLGCKAKFLFSLEINSIPCPAVAEFSTGQTAYAIISDVKLSQANLRIGEYINDGGKKIAEQNWLVHYNKKTLLFQIVDRLMPSY